MLSRGKIKFIERGGAPGLAFLSALRTRISPQNPTHNYEDHASLSRDFGNGECPAELQGVIRILRTVRQRILINAFLQGLTNWWTWILAGLIVIGAISARLTGAMIFAVILAIAGAAVILTWIFRARISIYDTARRLDSAAGLHDRISTAVFLADVKNPDEMMRYQRSDAIGRAGKVDFRGLFPVRMPATASRALVLFLAAAGLFAYRLHHRPPLVALLQTTARSQLVQSIISPIIRNLEKDLQRSSALASSNPEPPPDQVRPGDTTQPNDNLWQNNDDKGNTEDEQQEAVTSSESSDEMQQGDGNTLPSDEAGQPSAGQQPPQDMKGNQSASNSGDSQSGDSQSMTQSLMQALKNMMPSQQQANSRPNQQQQPGQKGMPQSGDSHQPGTNADDAKNDSRGNSDAQQKSSENSSSGAGNQAGTKELKSGLDSRPVKAVPDRVALSASGFKDPTRIRNATDTGTAAIATGNASPQATATTNGAEQEDIPARYRLYVQHYFEHPDNPDSGQQQ